MATETISEQELAAARRIIAAHQTVARATEKTLPRDYHGPIDLTYVRGTDVREFPKAVYKPSKVDPKGYITRVIQSKEEQDKLPKAWLVTTEQIHGLLDPIAKAQYITADDIEGEEPEEKEHSARTKQAAKDSKGQ
jgi:hypothetical protein